MLVGDCVILAEPDELTESSIDILGDEESDLLVELDTLGDFVNNVDGDSDSFGRFVKLGV